MSKNIYVFPPTSENFNTLGLCGALEPISCDFEEIANGLSEISLEHPLDHFGKWQYLRNDNIIGADVPVRTTPEIDNGVIATSVETWVVSVTADKSKRYVMSKESGGKKLKLLSAGTEVAVVKRSKTSSKMLKIKTGKVSGWMSEDSLTYESTTTISSSESSIESVMPAWETRQQLFRIYSVELSDDKSAVKIQAKHISYDLMFNVTTYDDSSAHTLQDTCDGILDSCIGSHDFTCRTAISGTHSGVDYCDTDPITAILDPDTGICTRWNAQFVRDNYELYLLNMGGIDRGVVIEYGSNITGVSMQTDMSSVATRIRPIGSKKDGSKLYLDETEYPDGCVDSTLRTNYSFDRIVTSTVSEAKVSDSMTVEEARQILLNNANELYSNGADMPTINVSVEFELIGNDDRYKNYRNLEAVYLFDTVRVYYPPLGIDLKTSVVRCVFDVLKGRMKSVELGDLLDLTPTVESWQVGSIDGAKIISGTVSAASYTAGSVTTRQLADSAVTTAKINDGAITYDKLSQSLKDLLNI